jgi:hypothetical protein
MKIDDVRVTREPRVLAKLAEIDALEAELWVTFPSGYRAYVTKLGEGVLGGDFVRIFPPWRISKELEVWRQRIAKYWFWDKSRTLLPKERALECVIVGDTTNGDEMIFHPTRPGTLFVLPRERATAFEVSGDLWTAIEFACSSGKLTKAFAARNFEPFDSRKDGPKKAKDKAEIVDPEGESLDALMTAARRWAKRHGARKAAQRDLRETLKDEDITGLSATQSREQKTTFVYEALVIDDERPFGAPAYSLVYRIDDKKTGFEIATYTWTTSESGPGFSYAQNLANVAKLNVKTPKG